MKSIAYYTILCSTRFEDTKFPTILTELNFSSVLNSEQSICTIHCFEFTLSIRLNIFRIEISCEQKSLNNNHENKKTLTSEDI